MTSIVGIDLGTSYSCVSIIERGRPITIPNSRGSCLTPSVVHLLPNGDALVGDPALQRRFFDPAATITGIKRLIGRRFNEVIDLVRLLPYEITIDDNNLAVVRVHGRTYSPQVLASLILTTLKAAAEAHIGSRVDAAVLTVPAYFNDIQREATREAARLAGLEPIRLINEPTAASLAYGLGKKDEETVLVFDLGGGTFDVSILEIGEGVAEVRSTNGDGFLGGDDFDERIAEWMTEEFRLHSGIDVASGSTAGQRIRTAAIEAKHDLSERHEVVIHVPFLAADGGQRHDLNLTLTRASFAEIVEELFERLRLPVKRALEDSGLSSKELHHAVLVGGATRMPGIDEILARTLDKPPRRGVNPDEAVALGAGIQAGVLGGSIKDTLLLDVVPASLSIEIEGGAVDTFIPRNTTIPTRRSKLYATEEDGQTSVEVHILEGEGARAEEIRTLSRLVLQGIQPGQRRQGTIEVTMDIDANGVLRVSAKDTRSGESEDSRVVPWTGITRAALERLKAQRPRIVGT